jgi:hypothetical protein
MAPLLFTSELWPLEQCALLVFSFCFAAHSGARAGLVQAESLCHHSRQPPKNAAAQVLEHLDHPASRTDGVPMLFSYHYHGESEP